MDVVEVFIIRKTYKSHENTFHISQSLTVGRIGVFAGLILAPKPYI